VGRVKRATLARPRLLDLFCGAGGAAMGYHRAGFDVVGVDNRPQPRYPFEFHQADAMTFPLDGFAAIHASPPCQDHMLSRNWGASGTGQMLPVTRSRLQASGLPWVIENVPGAPMRPDLKMCGCMFRLPGLERVRWFETSWRGFELRPPCQHIKNAVTVYGGGGHRGSGRTARKSTKRERETAMGIAWMTLGELNQAIPPAYTEHIGRLLLDVLEVAA
jgi:DNA (cytosine-5)-methyltransferase 1